MKESHTADRTAQRGAVEAVITAWAILGGGVLLLVVAMNVASVVGGIWGRPFPGDFEMTQIGVAVAAFAFLPYCQLTDANVTADIFTARARPQTVAVFRCLAAVVAFVFSIVLVWRMSAGMSDQRAYDYTTAILQFPVWSAFLPILLSLALLSAASVVTLIDSSRAARDTHS